VASRDDQLWKELSGLLRNQPGWSVQASPTPGVGPNWTFSSHGKVDFSVFTDGGALHLYEEETDRDLPFDTVEDLMAWLNANKAFALRESPPESRQPFLRWR
jgi:hypothetical protein